MWSLFSRDPLKDFAYDIDDEIIYTTKVGWELHKGTKKGIGELVSVFICSKQDSESKLLNAKAAIKRLKTLRHPNILRYVDSLESDKMVYLVTERVEPLDGYFCSALEYTSEQKMFAISWGLHQIAKGAWFLSNDCNLNHNNICMDSIFVGRSGEWQLGGMEFVCPCLESPPSKPPTLDVYAVKQDSRSKVKWAVDSWGLGCLIWETFNGVLTNSSSLKNPGNIPKSLTSSYAELMSLNPSNRMSPGDFVSQNRSGSGFLKNSFVDTMLFLEEIQVKEVNETSHFFSSLGSLLDSFPKNVCIYKILPQLINAFEFGNAGSAILNPIFKIGKDLDSDEYQKKIVPCVVKLFSSKDRSTRAKLLQQIDQFVHHLQPALVNEQIFPQISQGFMDTNPTIREQTIKSMIHIAPKLNYQHLNDEVMKHFARLQVKDEQGGIRTNTTVCLGKIAGYLHPQMRQKMLITAFARAMRDPFPQARIAGIVALSSTQKYYTLQDCAKRILPVLCQLTVDPESSVREQAFCAIKGFLGKLEKVSENPDLIEEFEAEVNTASTSSASSSLAASLAGWAVTNFTAKFYKSSKPKVTSSPSEEGAPPSTVSESKQEENVSKNNSLHKTDLASVEDKTVAKLSNTSWNDESWTEEFIVREVDSKERPSEEGWSEEGWQDFDLNIELNSSVKSSGASFKSLNQNQSDWGSDWDVPLEDKQEDKEEARRKREEKKLQRQSELQERRAARQTAKGPMKLGAKRI